MHFKNTFTGALILMFFNIQIISAAVYTTAGSGNWNSGNNNAPFPGGVVPGAGDEVIIGVGHTVTLAAPASCLSLTLNTGAGAGGILTGASALTLAGNVTVSYGGGVMTSGATISCPINLGANRIFTVANDGTTMTDLTVSGIISDAFSVSKSGAGALTLSGANNHTGGVTLNAGTLNINNASALGAAAGTFTINGGTIDNSTGATITMANANPQIWNASFAFTGTRNLTFAAGAITMNADITITCNGAANRTLACPGVISGGFKLTKEGARNLTLSGANTFTGGVTLNAGILNINNASALGAAAGTFTINGGTINSSSGAVTMTAANPQIWNANFAYTGSQNLTFSTGAITMNTNITITCNGTNRTLQYNGAISGSYRLSKAGTGLLALAGANTHSGTTLNAGTLNINHASALGDVGSTFIINAGTINNRAAAAITTLNYPLTFNADFAFT